MADLVLRWTYSAKSVYGDEEGKAATSCWRRPKG